jgi:hypothetical protein
MTRRGQQENGLSPHDGAQAGRDLLARVNLQVMPRLNKALGCL